MMKGLLFFILSFLSVIVNAQLGIFPTVSQKGGVVAPSTPEPVFNIDFTMDKDQAYADDPIQFTMDPSVPEGSTYFWEIKNSKTGYVKFTSTERDPTFTFDSVLQRYDANVTAVNANPLTRNFHAIIVVIAKPPPVEDYHLDLNALTDTKGTHFTNSATAIATNGSPNVVTSANHGLSVGDHVRVAYGGGFYTCQAGTTGTDIVLDRNYEGITRVGIPNAETLDLGTTGKTYLFDLATLPGGITIDLFDRNGNDTGYNIKTYPDKKIKMTGDLYGYMQFDNISGTYLHPVYFYNEGLVRFFADNNSLPYCIQSPNGFFQHVVINGRADPAYEYGIEFHGNRNGGDGQLLFINGPFKTNFYCTGVKVKEVFNNDAGSFSWDMPHNTGTGASHRNTITTATSGATTLVLTSTVPTTLPAAGTIAIHTAAPGGGCSAPAGENQTHCYTSAGTHFYNYSSFNAATKTFTLTSPLSQTYSSGEDVNISISTELNWYAEDVWYWHNFSEPTDGGISEGYYVNFNNALIQQNGFRPSRSKWVYIFDCIINSSKRDGIQLASTDYAEVHNNIVYHTGMGDFDGHENAVSWNDGNRNGIVSRNIFIGHKDFIVAETNQGGDCLFSANVMDIDNGVGGAANSTYFFEAVEVGAPADVNDYWVNNTVIGNLNGTGILFFTMQYSGGTSSKSLLHTVANNVIFKRNANETNYNEMATVSIPPGDRTNWLVSNELFLTSQTATPKFVDYANKNYDITDATSPLFNSGVDLTSRLAQWPDWAKLDINGYSYNVNSGYTSGAYSGYRAFINP